MATSGASNLAIDNALRGNGTVAAESSSRLGYQQS